MKKILFSILTCIFAVCSYAQKTWTCPEYDADFEKYSAISKEYKSAQKKWSQKLLEAFPIASDNTIKYQYVVKTDSTFNVEDISNSLLSWYKVKMTNVNPVVNGSPDRLSGIATLRNVGSAIGYMNATFISAQEEVTIDIKENRVRITVIILGYFQANTWKGAEKVAPGACFPVNEKGKQKDSHAMAFINSHYDAICTVGSIIKHLNENTKVIKNGEEDW